jgi:hypothetical protein
MQRPTGVTILAILAVIGGVFGLLGGVVLIGLSTVTDLAIPGLGGFVAILGLITLVLAVLDFVFAYGAWGLKPWAWTLGIGLEVVSIIVDILGFRSSTASSTVIGIVIAGIIIYYLYQPHVRRAFGQNV